MEYNLYPTSRDILHFGKGHDDSPPGRGSGRFAFGSGKRPHQHIGKKQPKTKEEILKSAKAKDVLAIQSDLSVNELREAKDRIELNNTLSSYAAKQQKTRWEKVNDAMKKVNDVVNWTETGIKAWNNFAAIYNATAAYKGEKKRLAEAPVGSNLSKFIPMPKVDKAWNPYNTNSGNDNSGGGNKKKDKKKKG